LAALESQLIISADDRTAAAFASVQDKLAQLQSTIATLDRVSGSPALANAGAFAGPGAALAEHAEALKQADRAAAAGAASFSSAAGGAVDGLLSVVGTVTMATAAFEGARQSLDQAHEAVRAQAADMTAGEVKEGQEISAKLAEQYPSVPPSDVMNMLRNARAIVGTFDEAKAVMPDLMRLFVVAQGANVQAQPEELARDFDQLVKGLEIKGVTMHPEQFHEYMQGIAPGLNAFGDTLKPEQYYEMFKYGRQATPMLSQRFMLGTAPSLAQELGGTSYGRAVSDFNAFLVEHHGEHQSWRALGALGLLAPEDADVTQTGEIKGVLPGRHIKGDEIAQTDPNAWVRDYLIPAMTAHGITSREAQAQEIGEIFSNKMAAQMVSILATQQARIEKDLALVDKAKGLEASEMFGKEDPRIAGEGLWNTIKSAIASGIPSDLVTDLARAATAGVNLLRMPGGARDIHGDLEADRAGWERLGKELLGAFGPRPEERVALFERYAQGTSPTAEDIMREPSQHTLGEARRIQAAMEADREAARGAALMATPSDADVEAARKLAAAATLPVSQIIMPPAQGSPESLLAAAEAPLADHEAERERSRGLALGALPASEPHVVNVSGEAQVDQRLYLTVDVAPELRATIDQITNGEFSVPLTGAPLMVRTDRPDGYRRRATARNRPYVRWPNRRA
jgi:hypothetical protein